MKMRRISLFVVIIFIFSLFSTNAFAALKDDEVLSQNIKEADGTSGQDTNTGSGVKTWHIQDNAVTTGKISDGAVTDAKITGPISGSKLGSHTHSGADVTDGTITNAKIAIGVVTPDKIGFYQNVIIVVASGGDFTSPVDAMNSITDASASNPYLVKIMPGVYDIGSNSVQMKEYVDIEGSGENTTTISGASDVVLGASNAELRFLTILSNGGTVISNTSVSPKITNVTVTMQNGGWRSYGISNNGGSPETVNVTINAYVGVYNTGGTNAKMRQMRINASSKGIRNEGSDVNVKLSDSTIESGDGVYILCQNCSLNMRNVDISGSIGINIYGYGGGTIKIDNSSIAGTGETIHINAGGDFGAQFYIGNSKLDGGPVTGNVTCAGVYDENYTFYTNTCPQ